MLRGAILGFGQVAQMAHCPAWKRAQEFSIVALADNRRERRDLASKLMPGVTIYETPEKLLKGQKQLDFVDIATPPALHVSQILLALQNRCHVLCEKPLALNRSDLEKIRTAATFQKRAVFTVHNWKYAPLFQKLQQLLCAGAIGPMSHIELHTLRNQPALDASQNSWRTDRRLSGGGILIDHGWHCFYLLHWLLQASPRAAYGELKFPQQSEAETEATCLIRYPDATAVVHLTWNAPKRSHWGIVRGTSGSIVMEDDRLLVTQDAAPAQTFLFPRPLSHGSAHPDWFYSMLPDFKLALADPRQASSNFNEAADCLWLVESIYSQQKPPPSQAQKKTSSTP